MKSWESDMRRYDSYKDSGVAWIGEVPEHWEIHKVKEHFTERKEKVSDKEFPPLSVSKMGVVPQLDDACKTDNGDNRKLVCKGDYVVNSRSDRKGSCGVSSLTGSVSLINIVLCPRNIISLYIHYMFRSNGYIEEFYRNGRGIVADLWTTRYTEMRNIYIPIPPLDEQQNIVEFLDEKTAKIDTYIQEKKKEISFLEELKQAEIAFAVTHGVNSNIPMKDSGIAWIGEIPEHWEVKRLRICANEYFKSNEKIHHQNLLSLSYGKIIRKDINKTDGLLPASFDKYQIVSPGHIILRLTDLQNDHKSLRVGLVAEEGIITSAYLCLNPQKGICPDFLYYLLHSYDIKKVFYGMGGGLRQSLGFEGLKNMKILVPPIAEQYMIVEYIQQKTVQIDTYISDVKKQIDSLKEYRQRLICDAVTGRINVQPKF